MKRLKECPLCGTRVKVKRAEGQEFRGYDGKTRRTDGYYYIHCSGTMQNNHAVRVTATTKAGAVLAWNTRAAPTLPDEVREAVERASAWASVIKCDDMREVLKTIIRHVENSK